MILRVIVAAREKAVRNRLARLVASQDVLLTPAPSLHRLLATPEAQTCDLIIAQAAEVGAAPEDALRAIQALIDRPDVVLISDGDDHSEEARLLAAGAMAVVSGGLPDRELAAALRSLLDRRRDGQRVEVRVKDDPHEAPCRSTAMQELLRLADRVAGGDSSILILGETGVGKEWLAHRIHASSRRAAGPFVAVNCAAIAEGLVESELFGHVKGAFTGAIRSKRGHFEMAHGGTLLLDEVGDVSRGVQVKLLRVLQDRMIQPVGGERPITVDVRIIAATNRDLERDVTDAAFRQDLFYRLAVITLNVPPLRVRTDDLPGLVDVYVRHFAAQLGRPIPAVSHGTMDALRQYSWPGNIRELINALERAVLLCPRSTLEPQDLPVAVWAGTPRAPDPESLSSDQSEDVSLSIPFSDAREEAVRAFEVKYLTRLLEATAGRVGDAARMGGLSPRSLYQRMRTYGLQKEDFRT